MKNYYQIINCETGETVKTCWDITSAELTKKDWEDIGCVMMIWDGVNGQHM